MDKGLQTMIDNMPEKTGKSLNDWKTVLASFNFSKHMEAVNFLKKEHGVSHGFANTIVSLFKDDQTQPKDLVDSQYKGKEKLIPIYDQLIEMVKCFGNDVKISPKKTTVSIIRKKQFALIKPATKTRIDLGLKLKGEQITDRLGVSGPFGTMCTHRVKITGLDDLDSELKNWLLEAYKAAQ